MSRSIQVRMMKEFAIAVDGEESTNLLSKSRKGVALMEYLILNQGKWVPKQRLLGTLWSVYTSENPESALKTLVSRIRKLLKELAPELAECIVSERGAYRWESVPPVKVDVLEIMEIFEKLPGEQDPKKKHALCDELRRRYQGDLYLTGDLPGSEGYTAALHNEYMNAVYDEIELFKEKEEYNEICRVCEIAQQVDSLDERINLELMEAMSNASRTGEALKHYRRAEDLSRRYLEEELSDEMRGMYRQLVKSGHTLKYNLDAVRNELQEGDRKQGAFVCEYPVFREIYNLQMFNLKRVGATMFLGLIMLFDENGAEGEESPEITEGLLEVMRGNLRRGDIISRITPTLLGVLLPTVNYTTGNLVMERIHKVFQERFPETKLSFQYRLGEMGMENQK